MTFLPGWLVGDSVFAQSSGWRIRPNANDRSKINPVRKEFFGAARPASTLIGVSELAIPGMKVEIEAVVGFGT